MALKFGAGMPITVHASPSEDFPFAGTRPPVPMLVLLRLLLLSLCLGAGTVSAAAAPPRLDDRGIAVDVWPAVTVLADDDGRWTLDDVLQRSGRFAPPASPRANLGVQPRPVWLRFPLVVEGRGGRWVLEIDYPPLNRVEVYLLRDGRLLSSHLLGNEQPFEQRPLRSRAHAVGLTLEPGTHEVLMRVQSTSSMLLPARLYSAHEFLAHESAGQMAQGLLLGITLALLAYSAVNAIALRDSLFAQYAAMLLGVTTFFVAYTGVGQQYLWSEQTGLTAKIAPLAILLALASGSLFVGRSLDLDRASPRAMRGLRTISALSVLVLLASVAGLLDYRRTQLAATLLGPLPMLVAVPAAFVAARRGDRAARFMVFGWGAYTVGALSMAGLLRGLLPAEPWIHNLFQYTSLIEMLAWVRVLGLRIETMRRDAERVSIEHDALRSLAHTDALTGLPNRRGLSDALSAALPASRADHAVAVYLLDLDGFKPVNDRHGHDVGDGLLVQVGQRLRSVVRSGDLVARIGGDEFVVMAPGIPGEADAMRLGAKLLEAFREPFFVAGQRCEVGLTAGLALAPHDGLDAAALLKRADAAMYEGKQAGRHCLRRSAPAAALAAAAGSYGITLNGPPASSARL